MKINNTNGVNFSDDNGKKKDINNKHHLVIDDKAANIVKYIYYLKLIGKTNSDICKYLDYYNVPTPNAYKENKMYNDKKWNTSSVHNILKNYMYTGNLVQGTKRKLSYKSKKRISVDRKYWIIVNNTHESIISEKVFNIINSKRKINNKLLLNGLVYCYDCKSLMSIKKDKRTKKIKYYLNCNRYSRNCNKCFSHFISYNYLEKYVLDYLKKNNISINNIKSIEVAKNKKIIINYL